MALKCTITSPSEGRSKQKIQSKTVTTVLQYQYKF